METKTYNVLVSSKNKKAQDTNTSFQVSLNNEFFINNEEDLYVCMTQFHAIKSFYSCQTGLNDHFQVIFKLPNEPIAIEVHDRYLPQGNYDYKSLIKEIKALTNNGLFDITYDAKLNKFLFKNLFQPAFEVYIKPVTAGIFLGLENGVEYLISAQDTYSTKFINLSGYTSLVIKLEGDLNVENSISNLQDEAFRYDKVLGVININAVAPMDSITFENDGCLFRHKVVGQQVSTFKVKIVSENGNEYIDMADWIMSLKFEKIRKNNPYTGIERLLANINFYLGSMFLYFNIPSRVSLADLVGQ